MVLALGEAIDRRRVFPRIDRAGHEDHRARALQGRPSASISDDRSKHGDGRLADRHHMHVSSEKLKKLNDIVDVVVEVERAVGARHEAGVLPFGDIDVVMGKEVAHRAAEKRGEMPGQRRNDQDLGVVAAAPARYLALEMDEIAERLGDERSAP